MVSQTYVLKLLNMYILLVKIHRNHTEWNRQEYLTIQPLM